MAITNKNIMTIKVLKILAVGCSKRFAWFDVDGIVHCVRINDMMYLQFKHNGVPTSQSLRSKH